MDHDGEHPIVWVPVILQPKRSCASDKPTGRTDCRSPHRRHPGHRPPQSVLRGAPTEWDQRYTSDRPHSLQIRQKNPWAAGPTDSPPPSSPECRGRDTERFQGGQSPDRHPRPPDRFLRQTTGHVDIRAGAHGELTRRRNQTLAEIAEPVSELKNRNTQL